MNFLDFLIENNALTDDNIRPPKLGEWVQRFLEKHPIEEQEREILESMSKSRWIDADQVLEELERADKGE